MARLTIILGVLATVIYLLDGFRFLLNEWRHWRHKGTWLVVLGLCLMPTTVLAEDLYVGQSDAGLADGTSCANQHSAAWFNTAANWGGGAGEIDPGDTAHLCGTITTGLVSQASGSVGSLITILFETGAKISKTVCDASAGCFSMNSKSYLVLDGGTNGIVESTDNGTVLGSRVNSIGVSAFPCSNCEIKNLTIQNIYVHTTDLTDVTVDYSQVNAIKLAGSNTTVHHNILHDAGWAIYQNYGTGDSGVEIHHNEIYNSSHGWTVSGNGAISASNFKFYNNHVYNYSNWDTTANAYHHDGIHAFGIGGAAGDQYDIYNNLFEGACGDHMTGHIFMEGGSSAWTSTGVARLYNNILVCDVGNIGNFFVLAAGTGGIVVNNTLIGGDSASGICLNVHNVTNAIIRNNAITGCNQLLNINAVTTFSNVATDIDYNTYVCAGSSNCFNWTGVAAFKTFAQWLTLCGSCDTHSSDNATLMLDSAGRPTAGSPVIDAGTDLSGLGIAALNADYYGNARPAGASWDTGAIEYGVGASSPVVIARVVRWVEVLLPIVGVGWHCRKWVATAMIAGLSFCSYTTMLMVETTKIVSYTTALKTAQIVVRLTKKDL